MNDYRTRYRLQTWGTPRSSWKEWGPFLLALILGAGLLIGLAVTSPIFSGPKPLPASSAPAKSSGPAASSGAPASGPALESGAAAEGPPQ